MTVSQVTLNLLAQIIPGTLMAGNPIANMVRKMCRSMHTGRLIASAVIQSILCANASRGDLVRSGSKTRALHQSTTTGYFPRSILFFFLRSCALMTLADSASRRHSDGVVHPDWCQTMDVRQRQGHMFANAGQLPHVSSQSGVLHCFCGMVGIAPTSHWLYHSLPYPGGSSDRRANLEKEPCITQNYMRSSSVPFFLSPSGFGSADIPTHGSNS